MNKAKLVFMGFLVFLLMAGAALPATYLSWRFTGGAASAVGTFACDIKTSCDAGQVEVFRMSATGNAHGGTPSGSSYPNLLCCGGVAGLGTSCSGTYDTVLRLSATDNAHVSSDASYSTQACLSVPAGYAVNCTYGASCDVGYACLATISGTTNAHVADCDGVNDYGIKVCCYAGPPLPVGGIAELPGLSESQDSPTPYCIALAGAATGFLALTAGAWYARRRWGR
jgi:hypothetical protein